MAELSNIGSGNRATTSRALKQSSALESGTARSPSKSTLCKTRRRASSSLIILITSVSNRRLATPMKLPAGDEIGVRGCKLRIGNPKLPAIFSPCFW
jgi:hypothetical protein